MKRLLNILALITFFTPCFSQLNIVDSQSSSSPTFNSQTNNIAIELPFTAFVGKNNLVDNYLCYNGNYYFILAKKTTNPSDKSISFVLGATRESSLNTLRDLYDFLSEKATKTSITVNMGGIKHVIQKTDNDILSFSSQGTTGSWLLDKNQINICINQLSKSVSSNTTVNQNAMFKGGSGSSTGTGSGLGPGEGSGSGGGIGYGTGSRGLVKQINTEISEEGQVAVEVHVMADGTVSEAHIVNNSKGRTTITNTYIQQQCIREAKKAKYKPGKEELRIILFN